MVACERVRLSGPQGTGPGDTRRGFLSGGLIARVNEVGKGFWKKAIAGGLNKQEIM
jgi:hypothetical protein